MKVKYLTLYRDHKHYKIFDIYNAKEGMSLINQLFHLKKCTVLLWLMM
jgi:hypothetical protein